METAVRTNGSDDLVNILTKRERAAIDLAAAYLSRPDAKMAADNTPDTKHAAFVGVAMADALFDELGR